MSRRTDRLNARAEELRVQEHIAQIRVGNAQRAIAQNTTTFTGQFEATRNAYRAELDAARGALRSIHVEQHTIIEELDCHTTDLPDLALILVSDPEGPRVIERRDPSNVGTDETNWYDLGAGDEHPMSFDEAIGVTPENPQGHEFFRLYTQDEVDDLLDVAFGV
jgi:hypothetical protein